jgi:hypothetical protein
VFIKGIETLCLEISIYGSGFLPGSINEAVLNTQVNTVYKYSKQAKLIA